MREIKFRAWMSNDKYPDGKMYYIGKDSPFVINFNGDVIEVYKGNNFNQVKSDCYWARVGNNDIQLMQYTGLKDKSGKEIYEGDIINNHFEVKFNDYYGAYMGFSKIGSFFLTEEIRNPVWGIDNPIVTGNIYTNPELLEAK